MLTRTSARTLLLRAKSAPLRARAVRLVCVPSAEVAPKKLSPPVVRTLPGVLAGAGGGMLGALCGVGGGLLLLPALMRFGGGMTMQQASATGLFCLTMGSSVGAATYLANDVANIPTSCAVFIGSSIFSIVGARAASLLPSSTLSMLMKPIVVLSIPLILSKTDAFHRLTRALEVHHHISEDVRREIVVYLYYLGELYLMTAGTVRTGTEASALSQRDDPPPPHEREAVPCRRAGHILCRPGGGGQSVARLPRRTPRAHAGGGGGGLDHRAGRHRYLP
jgi:uncharacterized membrane protein YfcA